MSSITSLLSSGLEDYLYTYIQTIVSMIDKVKKNKYKSTLLLRLWWSRQRICLFYTAVLPSSHYEEHLYIPSFITESMPVHSSTQCIYYGIHSHQIDLQKLLFWVHLHSQRPRRKIHHQSQYKQEYNQSMLFLWIRSLSSRNLSSTFLTCLISTFPLSWRHYSHYSQSTMTSQTHCLWYWERYGTACFSIF